MWNQEKNQIWFENIRIIYNLPKEVLIKISEYSYFFLQSFNPVEFVHK